MVQLMKSSESEQLAGKMASEAAVKVELEDPLEEEHGSLHKRPKRQSFETGGYAAPSSQYNPLDEPSPLGLSLRKSPSLLELIQMKLSQASNLKAGSQNRGKKQLSGIAPPGDKLKACNFPALILKIGSWEVHISTHVWKRLISIGHQNMWLESLTVTKLLVMQYKSRYEGDLVAKCYFAKHKLVWEVLDGGLKNKIEIQWSDIMALKANYPEDGSESLDVVLSRQPLFFRETNPQPRKHTLWQATSDFTGGQASMHKRHYLECSPGLLGKHIEKLTQCDPRLHFLSQQGEILLDSPYFEPRTAYDDKNEDENESNLSKAESPSLFSLTEAGSPSGVESSSLRNNDDAFGRHSESFSHETPSPCSARDILTVEDAKKNGVEQLKMVRNWEQIRVPGLNPSMSMSDLVSHLENRISEQGTLTNPTLSSEELEGLQILDDINRCLFSDVQNMPDSDEKSLMARVNSLCSLLQKDSDAGEGYQKISLAHKQGDQSNNMGSENYGIIQDESKMGQNQPPSSMSRKDSLNDLLLNLPRIASLPQFLFNISEDIESQAR